MVVFVFYITVGRSGTGAGCMTETYPRKDINCRNTGLLLCVGIFQREADYAIHKCSILFGFFASKLIERKICELLGFGQTYL